MPRKSMNAPSQISLLEQLTLGSIMQTYPKELVEQALIRTGTNSIRLRLLPSFLMVYLGICLCIYPKVSVKETLRIMLEQLRQFFGCGQVKIPVGSAITKARMKIGKSALKELFDSMVTPIATPELKGCFFKGRRLAAVDGCDFHVQDTPQNREYFGSHSNQYGRISYPSMRIVALNECGTRVIFAVNIGGFKTSEQELFRPLIRKLQADMLLLADRNFYSFEFWRDCKAQGSDLLWRAPKGLILEVHKELPDGSYISEVRPSDKLISKGLCRKSEKLKLRVIKYQVKYEDDTESEEIRLLTTILDHNEATAEELAEIYPERWEIENGFDEMKNHLNHPQKVLRSQVPMLVEQEFYGYLLAYFVVRKVITDAARKGEIAPNQLSFTHSVNVIKRKVAVTFFPSAVY